MQHWRRANRLGTVFSITTSGTEKVLHSFGKVTTGCTPTRGFSRDGRSTVRRPREAPLLRNRLCRYDGWQSDDPP